ncbi:MAG: hypothetical protein H6631_09050 [Anaerolineaceae bacterium]|nr:hypothetical protein [Anaerolineaceae bacterium]MCB9101063.1 hypothetical protein [Anaerolineales bacterium]
MKKSRKLGIVFTAVIMLTLMVTTVAIAGRMRYLSVDVTQTTTTGGKLGGNQLSDVTRVEAKKSGSVIIHNFTLLDAEGVLAGLGNLAVTVELKAEGQTKGNIMCTNHGQQLVDAQPRKFDAVEFTLIPSKKFDKNGSTSFDVTIEDFTSQLSPEQFCPNNNWTAEIEGFEWLSATVISTQPDGQVITASFNCAGSTQCVQEN